MSVSVSMNGPRRFGMGMIATGVVCPCHVLAWIAGLIVGAPVLTPAVQDGLHAVYVPLAVLVGAALLRVRPREPPSSINQVARATRQINQVA